MGSTHTRTGRRACNVAMAQRESGVCLLGCGRSIRAMCRLHATMPKEIEAAGWSGSRRSSSPDPTIQLHGMNRAQQAMTLQRARRTNISMPSQRRRCQSQLSTPHSLHLTMLRPKRRRPHSSPRPLPHLGHLQKQRLKRPPRPRAPTRGLGQQAGLCVW